MKNKLYDGMLGFVVGDALGVPVEFMSRDELRENPVTEMREFGTHDQPKGTWSDDTSLTLCLMASLINGVDYVDILEKFIAWIDDGYMSAHGELFDLGIGTKKALIKYSKGVDPLICGESGEFDNGNGSLMRILPLAFFAFNMSQNERFELVHNISSLTHSHIRSKIACNIYIEYVCELLKGQEKEQALIKTIKTCTDFYKNERELAYFNRILDVNIKLLQENEIKSSGYVIDTLEAVFWCFLTTENFKDCLLKAVNLGDDTDTIGAIVGSLAGIYYTKEQIPDEWIECIAKVQEIKALCDEFSETLTK